MAADAAIDSAPDQKASGTPAPDAQPAAEPKDPKQENHKGLLQRPLLLAGLVLAVVVVAVIGLLTWLHARHFESTDDAFIDTRIVRLAPQVAGRVRAVLVGDNQLVTVGQPLVSIDSADAQTRVDQSRAQHAQARAQAEHAQAQIEVALAAYRQSRADLVAADAEATNAAQSLARYQRLAALNPAAVAEQQFDQLQASAKQTAARRDAALQATRVQLAQVAAARALVDSGLQQVKAAQAQLDDAGLQLGYGKVLAPIEGHVAQMSVAVGDYLQPGTQLMAIVPLKLWVTANFKETQLADMRVGQPVAIEVDACPAQPIQGHVDSIQRGAGQAFALLPPENATGNYVKVVQRVPVKIVMDEMPVACPLGPGLSVAPRVTVR